MQANTVASSASPQDAPRETLPLLMHGELGLGTFLAPRQELQQLLPTPRLSVMPVPGNKTAVLALGLAISDSPLGSFQALLVGPLVTYSALRKGFWGQRRSLGFYPVATTVSTPDIARWLKQTWGVEADVASVLLSLAEQKPQEEAAPVGLTLKGPGWGERPLQREIFLYSTQGCRLCSSRLTLEGSLSLSLKGGRSLGLSGQALQYVPQGTSSVLLSLFLQQAELTCYSPGRCFDL